MAKYDKAFVANIDRQLKPLLVKMGKKQKQLQTLLLSSLNNPSKSTAYWNRLRKEVNILYAEMQALMGPWLKANIPMVMKKTLRDLNALIKADSAILNTATRTLPQMIRSTAPLSALMAQEASETFLMSLNAGRQNMIRFTRATQQVILSESQINLALLKGLSDTGDLRKAARVLSGEFWANTLDSIKNEQFVQAGRYRYTPRYYSELVARTKFHEAQSVGAMTTAKNYGTDLVQVSSHNTSTAICIPFEGNIYSISGASTRYPPLTDTPPYHPNCLHLLFPTFESALEGAA